LGLDFFYIAERLHLIDAGSDIN